MLHQDGGSPTVVFYRTLGRCSFHVQPMVQHDISAPRNVRKTALCEYYAAIQELRFHRRNEIPQTQLTLLILSLLNSYN